MTTEHKIIGGVVLLTILVIVGISVLSGSRATEENVRLTSPLAGEEIADQGRDHVPEGTVVEYNTNPPTSGPHYVRSKGAGIYEESIPDGNLIHSMEHGAVILWYKPDLPKEQVDQLKEIFRSVKIGKKIMVPRDNLDTPIALTSWGRLLKLENIDEQAISEFMEINADRGPEKAPL
jgi:hypothetical protein